MAKVKDEVSTKLAVVYSQDVTDVALKKLQKEYAVVPDPSTKEGYKEIQEALSVLRPLRTGVEKKRKELKKDALEYGRRVDEEAKRITDILLSIENPIKSTKDKYDEELRLEAERVENEIRTKISSIRSFSIFNSFVTVGVVEKAISDLQEMKSKIPEMKLGKREQEAYETWESTMVTLVSMLDVARAQEETRRREEERKREQAAKEALEREIREAELRKLKEEQAIKDEALRQAREEIEAYKRKIEEATPVSNQVVLDSPTEEACLPVENEVVEIEKEKIKVVNGDRVKVSFVLQYKPFEKALNRIHNEESFKVGALLFGGKVVSCECEKISLD